MRGAVCWEPQKNLRGYGHFGDVARPMPIKKPGACGSFPLLPANHIAKLSPSSTTVGARISNAVQPFGARTRMSGVSVNVTPSSLTACASATSSPPLPPRRPPMQQRMLLRSRLASAIRRALEDDGFVEIDRGQRIGARDDEEIGACARVDGGTDLIDVFLTFDDTLAATRAFNTLAKNELTEAEFAQLGVVPAYVFVTSPYQFQMVSPEPITDLAQLRGKKLRVPGAGAEGPASARTS